MAGTDRAVLSPPGEQLHVRGLTLTGTDLQGWQAVRIQRVHMRRGRHEGEAARTLSVVESSWTRGEEGGGTIERTRRTSIAQEASAVPKAAIDDLSDPPSFTRSMWRPFDSPPTVLVNINVFEAASRTAALALMHQMVGTFESPLLRPAGGLSVGETAFAGPGDGLVLFTRANVVCLLRNAGRRVTSVLEAAGNLDQDILRKPEPSRTQRLAIQAVEVGDARVGTPTPLGIDVLSGSSTPTGLVETSDPGSPLASPLEKFFSRGGEVVRQDGRLMYRPDTPGRHEIEIFAIASSGEAVRHGLVVTVR